MLKRSSAWVGLKKKLHERQQTPTIVSEREIWWAAAEAPRAKAMAPMPFFMITKYMLAADTHSKSHRGSWVHGQFGNVTEPCGSLRDLLADIHRMPALLTLSLPLSTDFGNAKP
jgi:hypothetical protein